MVGLEPDADDEVADETVPVGCATVAEGFAERRTNSGRRRRRRLLQQAPDFRVGERRPLSFLENDDFGQKPIEAFCDGGFAHATRIASYFALWAVNWGRIASCFALRAANWGRIACARDNGGPTRYFGSLA